MALNIEIKDVEEVLHEIKDSALETVVNDFRALLQEALADNSEFVKKTAEKLSTWTVLLGKGQLNSKQYKRLLKDQKSLAEQHVNTLQIAIRARIQKLTYSLLDIAIDILSEAISFPI
jgi:hypothetical protein